MFFISDVSLFNPSVSADITQLRFDIFDNHQKANKLQWLTLIPIHLDFNVKNEILCFKIIIQNLLLVDFNWIN